MDEPRLRLDEFLPYRLSVAANQVSEVIASAYRSLFGLTIAQWRLIAVTAESDGLNQRQIGQRTRMDKVTVSRAAIELVGRGLLDRQPHGRDGRSHLLVLSASGRSLYADVAPKALELERRLFGNVNAVELARFTATLRQIEKIAATYCDTLVPPPG